MRACVFRSELQADLLHPAAALQNEALDHVGVT